MPLSEYEQRVLDQMERSLASDDPKLASTLTSRRRQTGRLLLGLLAVVAGLGMLVGAVAWPAIWLGIVGFLLMLFGGYLAISKPRTHAAIDGTAATGASRGAKAKPAKSRASFMSRLEQRWDRRREKGDF